MGTVHDDTLDKGSGHYLRTTVLEKNALTLAVILMTTTLVKCRWIVRKSNRYLITFLYGTRRPPR